MRYLTTSLPVIATMAMFLFAGTPSMAQDGEPPSADDIVKNVNERDDGTSLTRTLSISMTDKRGKTREQMSVAYRKYYGSEKRSTIFYTEPANLKDTAFLTYDYETGDKSDDQWLYLPELRRVRRISSSNRGDYYLGTDFTYEDMKLATRLSRDDYNWETTGTEDINGHKCLIIEGEPKTKDIAEELGYGKYKAWVDPEEWLVHQTAVWDRNLNQLKTVSWRGWKQVDGLWAVGTTTAENHKTGHKTVFTFSDVDYATEIPDDVFTERGIMRGAPNR